MSKALERVQELLNRIENIEQICKDNKGIVSALSDELYSQPAIMMHLIVMQEQVAKLQLDSEYEVLSHISKGNLRGLAGVRNMASHDYEGLNFSIIENILRFYLPELKKELEQILHQNNPLRSKDILGSVDENLKEEMKQEDESSKKTANIHSNRIRKR